jgi:hypothetical protein
MLQLHGDEGRAFCAEAAWPTAGCVITAAPLLGLGPVSHLCLKA